MVEEEEGGATFILHITIAIYLIVIVENCFIKGDKRGNND